MLPRERARFVHFALRSVVLIWMVMFQCRAELQFDAVSAPFDLGASALHLEMAGGFAYVATGTGLAVCDVRDPSKITVRTNLTGLAGSSPIGVHLSGRRLYVTGFLVEAGGVTNNIAIFELDDSGLPVLKGSLLPEPAGVFCRTAGSFVLATSLNHGIYIFDVTNPGNPIQVGNIPDGQILGIGISESLVCVGKDGLGFKIVDISQPNDPQTLSSGPPGSGVSTDFVLAGTLLARASFFGWNLYGLENPANPVPLADFPSGKFTGRLVVKESMLYVINSAGFSGFDISDPRHPKPVGSFAPIQPATLVSGFVGMAIEGDRVAVTYGQWLTVFRIRDASLIPVGQLTFSDSTRGSPHLSLSGDLVMVKGRVRSGGVQLLSIQDPNHPTLVGEKPAVGPPRDTLGFVQVSGRLLRVDIAGTISEYMPISSTNAGIIESALIVGVFTGRAIASSGSRLYLAAGRTYEAFELSVQGPLQSGQRVTLATDYGGPTSTSPLAALGNRIFIEGAVNGGRDGRLLVVDYSNLDQPSIAKAVPVSRRIVFLFVAGDLLYAGLTNGVIQVYDVAGVEPRLISEFQAAHQAFAAHQAGGVLYVGLISGGFQVFDVRDPTDVRLLGGYGALETPEFSSDEHFLRAVSSSSQFAVFSLVKFGAPELSLRRGQPGKLALRLRGQLGESLALQRNGGDHWEDWQNIPLPQGYATVEIEPADSEHQLYRAMRKAEP